MQKSELKYIGRPTHYQTEIHVEAGETVVLDLPNGRIPIFMDFVGDLHVDQPRFSFFFQPKPNIAIQRGAFMVSWTFSMDNEGRQLESISIPFKHKADGIIRVLLVDPADDE